MLIQNIIRVKKKAAAAAFVFFVVLLEVSLETGANRLEA